MNRKLLVAALAVTALAVGACGDDDDDDSGSATTDTAPAQTTPAQAPETGGGKSDLKVDADPSGALKFTKDSLEAKAGTVTITMDNPSDVPHAIGVEGSGVDEEGKTVEKGGTSTVTVELKSGEYEFYCPVPGHKEGGMEGTLTVK